MYLDADDIAVASEHLILVQNVQVDLEAFQAVRQKTHMPLTCSWSSGMKRCSSWLFRVWSAVMAGLLLLCGGGSAHTFLQRRHLFRPPYLSRTSPSEKKVVMQCAPSPPQLCLCWFSTFNMSLLLCITKTKQNDTLLME